jgi:hypothetical protein
LGAFEGERLGGLDGSEWVVHDWAFKVSVSLREVHGLLGGKSTLARGPRLRGLDRHCTVLYCTSTENGGMLKTQASSATDHPVGARWEQSFLADEGSHGLV